MLTHIIDLINATLLDNSLGNLDIMSASNLSDIDIKLLRVFCTIVNCGGFSQALPELNLSRSTVSAYMSDLETRIGFKLCTRGRAGFKLTSRGRAVYEASKSMMTSIDSYHSQIAQLKDQIVGEISIGVVDNLITNPDFHLSLAIQEALKTSSDLRISLGVASPDQVEEQLIQGKTTLAITPQFRERRHVKQTPLFVEKQLLYCGKQHPLFDWEDDSLTLNIVAKQRYVRRGFVSVFTPYSSFFKSTALAVAFQMEGLAHFILSGSCVGFLPKNYAESWVKNGEMKVLRPEIFCFDVPICLSRNERKPLSPAESHIFDAILTAHT